MGWQDAAARKKCPQSVPDSVWEQFLPAAEFEQYKRFLRSSFVGTDQCVVVVVAPIWLHDSLTPHTHTRSTYSLRKRWCPNAGCPNLVMYPRGDTRDVTCKCGHSFCFQCLAEAHTPTDCSIVRKYGVGALPGTAASRAELTPLSLCSHLPPQMAVEGNPRG